MALKRLFCGLVASAAFAASANAADVVQSYEPPVEAPVVVEAPAAYSWSGAYLGGQLGYIFDDAHEVTATDRFLGAKVSERYLGDGDISGGAFAGYNYDIGNGLILGAEGDFEFTGDGDTRPIFSRPGSTTASIEKQGSVRARLGYAFDRALVYGTGGVAIGDVEYSANDGTFANSDGETEVGYTVGAGAEYAVTDQIFTRGEYRFTDYGTTEFSTPLADFEFDTKAHQLNVGVGYKF